MTTLLLIRHGLAESYVSADSDAERALTPEGWLKTRAAMVGLVARGLAPNRGLSSPYRRALETMACLTEAAQSTASEPGFPVGVWEGLLPDGDAGEAVAWLERLMIGAGEDEVIAFTSHQPFLGDLVARLTGQYLDIRNASCTVVEWMGGGWRFKRHLRASELGGES